VPHRIRYTRGGLKRVAARSRSKISHHDPSSGSSDPIGLRRRRSRSFIRCTCSRRRQRPQSPRRSWRPWWRCPTRCVLRPAAIAGGPPLRILLSLFGLLAQRFPGGNVSDERDRVPQQRRDAPPSEQHIVQLGGFDRGVALRVGARHGAALVVPKDQRTGVFGDRHREHRLRRRWWRRPSGSTRRAVSAAAGWVHATNLSRSGLFVHCRLRGRDQTRSQFGCAAGSVVHSGGHRSPPRNQPRAGLRSHRTAMPPGQREPHQSHRVGPPP
jgi:hypothetical protein